MATLTPDSFINLVKHSGLVKKETLKQFVIDCRNKGVDLKSTQALADELVARELLTSWQADKIQKGKHKGFVLGKYRLLSLLGKGGMSSVYLAEHTLMRRRCAIKVLPANRVKDTSYLARFHREAQAVAMLDHHNIVRAYDIDRESEGINEIHFLVMEYVAGESLHELVSKVGTLNFVESADFFRQAADGLQHAHQAGVIHRDIKPANLLIDESSVVKILDLGLARFFGESDENSLTVAHDEKVLGTADYLSPEQALDSHGVDCRCDIYSLGCSMYYSLAGRPPFNEGTLAQRLLFHQSKEPTRLDSLCPDIPVVLYNVIRQMMSKRPEDRYSTAGEVSQALTDWLLDNADDDWRKRNSALTNAERYSSDSMAGRQDHDRTPSPMILDSDNISQPPPEPASQPQPVEADSELASFLSNLDASDVDSDVSRDVDKGTVKLPTGAAPTPSDPVSTIVDIKLAGSGDQHDQFDDSQTVISSYEDGGIPTAIPVESNQPTLPLGQPVPSTDAVPTAIPVDSAAPNVTQESVPSFPEFVSPANSEDSGSNVETQSETQPANDSVPAFPAFGEVAPPPVATPVPPVASKVEPLDLESSDPPEVELPNFSSPTLQETTSFDAPGFQSDVPATDVFEPEPSTTRPTRTGSASKRKRRRKQGLNPIIAILAFVGVGLVIAGGYYVVKDRFKSVDPTADTTTNGKKKKSSATNEGSQFIGRNIQVGGPKAHFKTIGKAFEYIKLHQNQYRQASRHESVIITVASGANYPESIVLDDSSGFPNGMSLISDGKQKVVLNPTGPGPIVSLKGISHFKMRGFELKADGKETAIQLDGWLVKTKLQQIVITGFTKNGILGSGCSGIVGDELELEEITLKNASPNSIGMRFTAGDPGVSRLVIKKCRFIGPMSAAVQFESDASFIQLRDSIISGARVGFRFDGANRVVKTLFVANNTFHSLDTGIVFANLPMKPSNEFGFYKNLFSSVKGPELVIQDGYDDKAFYKLMSTSGGGAAQNRSDRVAPNPPVPGEHNIIMNPDTERLDRIPFVSTDPTSPQFLALPVGSPLHRVRTRRTGLKPYVGAVGP